MAKKKRKTKKRKTKKRSETRTGGYKVISKSGKTVKSHHRTAAAARKACKPGQRIRGPKGHFVKC